MHVTWIEPDVIVPGNSWHHTSTLPLANLIPSIYSSSNASPKCDEKNYILFGFISIMI